MRDLNKDRSSIHDAEVHPGPAETWQDISKIVEKKWEILKLPSMSKPQEFNTPATRRRSRRFCSELFCAALYVGRAI